MRIERALCHESANEKLHSIDSLITNGIVLYVLKVFVAHRKIKAQSLQAQFLTTKLLQI